MDINITHDNMRRVWLIVNRRRRDPMPRTTTKMDETTPKTMPRTISVPEAGRWLGIKKQAAYAAARNGEIPVIRIGKLFRVPVTALERMLEEARPRNEGGGNG